MAKKIFNGIKQVTADKFNEAKDAGLLGGYLWFVRTEVLVDGEETNTPGNDNYDIYFGSKQYGHFRAGELDAIREQIEGLNGDIDAINKVLEGLVEAAEKAQAAIAQEAEERKAADEEIRGNIEGLSNDIRSEVAGMEEALRKEIEAGNAAVREEFAASQEALRTAYEQADADMGVRIAVIEGEDAGKSMRTVANEELAKQLIPEDAQESLNTLQEIAKWIQDHPGDVTEMNAAIAKNAEDIATNADAIAKNAEDVAKNAEEIAGLSTKVADLEAADTALDGKIAAVNKRVDEVPVIETLTVNGVDATISDGVADVKIEADDIELGITLTANGQPKYYETDRLSNVLQGIQNSITQATSGSYLGVVSGDGISVSDIVGSQQTISAKVSAAEGNLISVSADGLFAAMYYEGDDE